MKRSELEHILRVAATIANDFDVLVLGSQSILGSFTEDELPEKAHASIEADVTFFDDDENDKSDLVDMHLGEDSHTSPDARAAGRCRSGQRVGRRLDAEAPTVISAPGQRPRQLEALRLGATPAHATVTAPHSQHR